jgi:hypothetical protein
MGCCRIHRRVCADETVRGQSYSRRHPQACLQNTPDEARDIRVINFRRDVFCVGLAPGAEARLSLGWPKLKQGEWGRVIPYKIRRLRSKRVP